MSLRIETGPTAPKGFLNEVYEIDKITYSPELCGKLENLESRYSKCKESFILLYDDDLLAGYINFFPVGKKLHNEMIDRQNPEMRDDDITPEEINDWSTEIGHDLFIISVALRPEYRKSNSSKNEAVVTLGNTFLDFLREKSKNGFKINSISGYAVSLGGVKFLKRLRASLLKTTTEGYRYFISTEESVNELLNDGLVLNTYKKSYESDLYFFIPMSSKGIKGSYQILLDANLRKNKDSEDFDYTPTEDLSSLEFGDLYCKVLNRHIEYECNSKAFKGDSIKRIYIGEYLLACYDDDYDGIALDTERVHVFVTAHRNTGIYILTLAIPENHYNPSQLIDQMSTGHLEISEKPANAYLENEKISFVSADKAIGDRFNLYVCGESKCVICMSNEPKEPLELPYLLSGETMISKHIDYKIRPERRQKLIENRAVYDYYDSYISRSVIAFVFKKYSHEIDVRMSDEASELFIVEIVLFQNTAVLRTNRKVIEKLEDNSDIAINDINKLYIEFGKTVIFWNSDIFKYPYSQIEANEVIKSFGIEKTLDEYYRNQQFLDRLIELKGTILDDEANKISQESDKKMNDILFYLSCIESCSITLGAVLWIVNLIEGDKLPSVLALSARFGWIGLFVIICLIFYRITSRKMLSAMREKRRNKKKK